MDRRRSREENLILLPLRVEAKRDSLFLMPAMFSSGSSVRQQLSECRNEIIPLNLGNRIKKFMLNIELGRVRGCRSRGEGATGENFKGISLN